MIVKYKMLLQKKKSPSKDDSAVQNASSNVNNSIDAKKPAGGKSRLIEMQLLDIKNVHCIDGKYYISKDPEVDEKGKEEKSQYVTKTEKLWKRTRDEQRRTTERIMQLQQFVHLKKFKSKEFLVKDIGPCERANKVSINFLNLQCNFKEPETATIHDLQYFNVLGLSKSSSMVGWNFKKLSTILGASATEVELPLNQDENKPPY